MHNLRYHILAFSSGAAVLILEIIGARILAPYLGTAFLVWVNIIGTILAALSAGYWLGGILADHNPRLLPYIFLAGAASIALIVPLRALLPFFGEFGIRTGSLLAAMTLFALPSMVLGMASPYIIKLATRDIAGLGKTSGTIFAASTLGSIVGTFVTGFWLMPIFSLTHILWGIVALLSLLTLVSGVSKKTFFLILIPFALLASGELFAKDNPRIILEKESQYYNIRVHDDKTADRKIRRTLLLDGSTQSARYLNSPEFPHRYIDLSASLIRTLSPDPKTMLSIGGGGFSIPQFVKKSWPETRVTVVEIDPMVTRVAHEFFFEEPGLEIDVIEADGRVFLNNNGATYGLIYTDAYSGNFSIPPHLASREAFRRMHDALADGGLIIFNIASAPEGQYSQIFRSLWKTMDGIFPEKAVFLTAAKDPDLPQNIVIVATKNRAFDEQQLAQFASYRYLYTPATIDVPVLTDDFAPTDHLMEDLVKKIYPSLRSYYN